VIQTIIFSRDNPLSDVPLLLLPMDAYCHLRQVWRTLRWPMKAEMREPEQEETAAPGSQIFPRASADSGGGRCRARYSTLCSRGPDSTQQQGQQHPQAESQHQDQQAAQQHQRQPHQQQQQAE
jgi:hypothetical protein